MIGPTSETGQAMLQSLMRSIQAGMPVDQAIQYVKSQAAVGVAPLVDLYSLLNQFQRMKQPQVQPPMGGSVKQQLDSLESARMSGLGGMRPGAMPSQMPQQMPQRQPMQAGLGGLDAGRMEEPQFAGGGIVAFDGGGSTNKKKDKTYADISAEAATRATPSLSGYQGYRDVQQALRQAEGLGEYSDSYQMELAEQARKEAALQDYYRQQEEFNKRAYWADVGQQAGPPARGSRAPDLVAAMALAQKGRVERERGTYEAQQNAVGALSQSKIALQKAREAIAKGDVDAYMKLVAEAKALQEEADKNMAKGVEERRKVATESAARIEEEKNKPGYTAEQIRRKMAKTSPYIKDEQGNTISNPDYESLETQLKDVTIGSTRAIKVLQLKQQQAFRKLEAAKKAMDSASQLDPTGKREETIKAKAALDAAQAEFNSADALLKNAAGVGTTIIQPQNLPPTSGATGQAGLPVTAVTDPASGAAIVPTRNW